MYVEHSDYLSAVFTPVRLKRLITNTCNAVRKLKRKLKFDAIAFTGLSGAGVAFAVSARTGIPLMCVRKARASNHGMRIEGTARKVSSYLILDDLISTGETIDRMIKTINKEAYDASERPKCVGILLWRESRSSQFEYKNQEIPVYSV